MERLGPLTADDLIQRREELRESGIAIDIDELTRDATPEVRDEFLNRVARIEAAEREVEASWWGGDAESAEMYQPQGLEGRYVAPQIRDEGGMGYLCSAFDVELNRCVAYKVMKPWKASDEAARALFFKEAEITSRLNHPGVVPVYGRVIDDCGLPAYACAFVSGRSLAWRIDEYRRIGPSDGRARSEARASLLQAFLAACEIVAYAHSEKIVHGDVKPLNIMTDDFGATRLVDWGLARIVDTNDKDDSEPLRRAGTRAFLSSPEGRPTYASDVFALGRTLAMVLAENPAGSGAGLRPAADAPRALWAVAEKATRPDAADRYGSPAALAEDVRAVLADQAIAVYRDPWPTRLRRWAARHRPSVAAALALLLALVAAGPVVGIRERGLRRRAEAERKRAVTLSREMLEQVDQVGKFQATLPGSREMLDRALQLIDELARDAEADGDDLTPVADSLYRAGRINLVLGQLEGAADCFRKSADLAARLALVPAGADQAADINMRAQALRDWGVVQVMLGRPESAALAWRTAGDVLAPVATRSPEHRYTHGRIVYAIGNTQMLAGRYSDAQAQFATARAILEPLVQQNAHDPRFVKALADVDNNIGFSQFYQAAPDGSRVTNPSRLVDAKQNLSEALRLRRILTELEPGRPEHVADVAASLNHLGNAAQVEGPPGRAAAADYYRQAADLMKGLVIAYPSVHPVRRELARIYSNLNVLLTAQGRFDDARASSNAAVEMFTLLVENQPNSPDSFADLGVALMLRARTIGESGDRDRSAADKYKAALAMARAASMYEDARRRDALAKQAVSLLGELNRQEYFRGDKRSQLLSEPGFADLRRRPDFPKL